MQKMSSKEHEVTVMTYSQAAGFLGISANALRNLVYKKLIPHVRFTSRTVRFVREDLEKWVSAKKVETVSPAASVLYLNRKDALA